MTTEQQGSNSWWKSSYDEWLVKQDFPVVTGSYVEDVRTRELDWWSLWGCRGAVLNLQGHQGVTEARVLEIPPEESILAFRLAVEEIIYVVEGQGIATIWAEGHPKTAFEWQKHSLFRIPNNYHYQLSNARGDQRALTIHMSYLPMAMGIHRNENLFFASDLVDVSELYATNGNPFAAEAFAVQEEVNRGGVKHMTQSWYANFFPDLTI